nr:hypothetical protein [Tanacetum cinerariifolium]
MARKKKQRVRAGWIRKNPDVSGVLLRWLADEEKLLAKYFVAVSEDCNVGKSQSGDTFWYWVMNEFNRLNFKKRNKDTLTSKWHTMNHNCQKFNAIYKRCVRLSKSGENQLDVMKRARTIYRDENKNTPFNLEDVWEVLRAHSKWDAPGPAPIDLAEDEHIPALIKPIQGVYDTRVSSQTESRRKGVRGGERKRPYGDAFGRVEISRYYHEGFLGGRRLLYQLEKKAIKEKYNLERPRPLDDNA